MGFEKLKYLSPLPLLVIKSLLELNSRYRKVEHSICMDNSHIDRHGHLSEKGGTTLKPFYELELTTRNRILGLIKQCEVSNLGNLSFEYYPTSGHNDTETFRLSQLNSGWELTVHSERFSTRDVYMIIGGQITHKYSEKD